MEEEAENLECCMEDDEWGEEEAEAWSEEQDQWSTESPDEEAEDPECHMALDHSALGCHYKLT